MFIKDSTYQIPPRDKGLQGNKIVDVSQETIDVSKESEPEPEPAKKKTASRRVVKKKVTISAADNIIYDLDVALELGKSISLTEAIEKEAARQIHATYARIVTESVPKPAKRRSSDPSQKLKGVQSVTLEEQEAVDTMKALKGTGKPAEDPQVLEEQVKELVLYQGFQMSLHSSLLPHMKELKKDKDGDADDEGYDHISDTQDSNDEDAETESDQDEIYKYKICMRKDVDVEMAEPETVEHDNKEKDVMTDAAKPNVEKSVEEKGDDENVENDAGSNYQVKESTEFPLPSSSLSVSHPQMGPGRNTCPRA
ncbi:hypothetical protein Tco_1074205 [Tanacetum coccineum]